MALLLAPERVCVFVVEGVLVVGGTGEGLGEGWYVGGGRTWGWGQGGEAGR